MFWLVISFYTNAHKRIIHSCVKVGNIETTMFGVDQFMVKAF